MAGNRSHHGAEGVGGALLDVQGGEGGQCPRRGRGQEEEVDRRPRRAKGVPAPGRLAATNPASTEAMPKPNPLVAPNTAT